MFPKKRTSRTPGAGRPAVVDGSKGGTRATDGPESEMRGKIQSGGRGGSTGEGSEIWTMGTAEGVDKGAGEPVVRGGEWKSKCVLERQGSRFWDAEVSRFRLHGGCLPSRRRQWSRGRIRRMRRRDSPLLRLFFIIFFFFKTSLNSRFSLCIVSMLGGGIRNAQSTNGFHLCGSVFFLSEWKQRILTRLLRAY